jgi:hypothetical protein
LREIEAGGAGHVADSQDAVMGEGIDPFALGLGRERDVASRAVPASGSRQGIRASLFLPLAAVEEQLPLVEMVLHSIHQSLNVKFIAGCITTR